jgi:hypothetical protein
MFKKSLLVTSVLSVGAVVSGVALADTGMSSTFCKPGFYAGVQAGWARTNYNNEDVLSEVVTANGSYSFRDADVDDTGIGGRVFGGYQFNPYFALEAGYTQFHKTDFRITSVFQGVVANRFDGEVTEHATDVVAKLTYPLDYGFGVFGKVGAAYIAADRHINESAIYSNGTQIPSSTLYTKSYQAVRPTWSAGVDYTIPNTSLDVDVTYTQILGGGGIPRADMAAIGITDKFA